MDIIFIGSWVGNFLLDAAKVILVLGLLIFIHELGHFIVAKRAGIKVHEFALGFGNKLFSKTKGETTYSVRLFPIGGFVKMEGEEEHSDDERAFNKKPVLTRMAVVLAGPLMNIALALLIFFSFVLYSGMYVSNQIEKVIPDTGAQAQGILPGDKIVKVDNKPVRIWADLNWYMHRNAQNEVTVTVLRGEGTREFKIKPTLRLNFKMNENRVIETIEPDSGLDKMGLKVGDRIAGINGISVQSPEQVKKTIDESQANKYIMAIERDNKVSEKSIDAPYVRRYIIGLEPLYKKGTAGELLRYSFWQSANIIEVMVVSIKDLVTGRVSLNNVMGPVGIISEISSRDMIIELLNLTAIISLNLGIVNLIPFPPLDGGKILTLTIEALRRKPIKPESEAMISMIGFSLLILLLLFVTFNDIVRSAAG